MKRCPVCGSNEIYECRTYCGLYWYVGEELLPRLAPGFFSPGAKIRPTVCVECGYVGLFASQEDRIKAKDSEHWRPIGRD